MNIYKENMIHLLFPPRCPFCDRVLFSSILAPLELVCPSCRRKPEYIREPACKQCGKPLEDSCQEYCYDCGKRRSEYKQGKALWVYQEEVKQSIYRFKYQGRREYARYYGRELARRYGGWMKECRIEALVPIPLYKKRQRQRGFNQAELIACEVSCQTEIPVYKDLLVRVRNTRAQKELNDQERKNNLKKAFKTRVNKVQLNHILLIDDIYTTGSTMNEAAGELTQSGAKEVYCLSLSIGRGYQEG
ncbi:ComF family protein [Lachnospiraceae bacterium]|nr:ComF family protein [Lachnospiraceae bacterium]